MTAPLTDDFSHVNWENLFADNDGWLSLAQNVAYHLKVSRDCAFVLLQNLKNIPNEDETEAYLDFWVKQCIAIERVRCNIPVQVLHPTSRLYHQRNGRLHGAIDSYQLANCFMHARDKKGYKALQASLINAAMHRIAEDRRVPILADSLARNIESWPHSQPRVGRDRSDRWWDVCPLGLHHELMETLRELAEQCGLSVDRVQGICQISTNDQLTRDLFQLRDLAKEAGELVGDQRHITAILIAVLTTHFERIRRREADNYHPWLRWGQWAVYIPMMHILLDQLTDIGLVDVAQMVDSQRHTLFGSHQVPSDLPHRVRHALDLRLPNLVEEDDSVSIALSSDSAEDASDAEEDSTVNPINLFADDEPMPTIHRPARRRRMDSSQPSTSFHRPTQHDRQVQVPQKRKRMDSSQPSTSHQSPAQHARQVQVPLQRQRMESPQPSTSRQTQTPHVRSPDTSRTTQTPLEYITPEELEAVIDIVQSRQ